MTVEFDDVEFDDFDSSCDVSSILDWALETGIWNGRQVSWMEASEFYDEVQTRILDFLFKYPEHPIFKHLAAQFAWIGTPECNQALLTCDIQELDFSKNDLILQVGLKKSLSKFWKKHKKEILIGTTIVAVVTVVVVVAVSTGGTGAGAAVASGAAFGACDKDKKEKLSRSQSKNELPKSQIAQQELSSLPAFSEFSLINNKLIFGEIGIVLNKQYTSYNNILLNRTEPKLETPLCSQSLDAKRILSTPVNQYSEAQQNYSMPWSSYPTIQSNSSDFDSEQMPIPESAIPIFSSYIELPLT